MDGPLFTVTRSELGPTPEEKDRMIYADPDEEINFAIEYDNKDLFLELMRNPEYKEHVSLHTTDWLFRYDAVDCVKALLNGETAGVLDFTADAVPFAWCNAQQVPILHKAAACGAPLITKLCLLENESQANLRIDVCDMKGALPLNLVLRYIRQVMEGPLHVSSMDAADNPFEWTSDPPAEEPDQLVVKMLFDLCKPSYRDDLEVVRLLAMKTVEIEQEFFKYLKERKVYELAALLMVARENVMPGLEGRLKIQDFVKKEIAALKIFMFRSTYCIGNDDLIPETQKKKMEMETILVLLHIFESIGDKIAAYLRLSPYPATELERIEEVTLLLKEAGLDAQFELIAEGCRKRSLYDFFSITSAYKNPGIKTTSNGINGYSNGGALQGSDEDNSYRKASDKAIADSAQSSMLWLRNKQNLLANFKGYRDFSPISFRSYHTYHAAVASRDFGSTTEDKVNGLALVSRWKKQYLVRGRPAEIASVRVGRLIYRSTGAVIFRQL